MNERIPVRETLVSMERLQLDAEGKLAQISDEEALRAWHQCYLGRAGAVTHLLRGISDLPAAQRPAVGRAANRLRQRLEASRAQREQELRDLGL